MAEELHVQPTSGTTPRWVVIIFAIVVPINVLFAVIDQWVRFGPAQKFMAVALLALLSAMAFTVSRDPRVQNRVSGRDGLVFGYTTLLLATILFGSHRF